MTPTLPEILEYLRPGATWELFGDTYEGLNWLDKSQSKPTVDEIEAARPTVGQISDTLKIDNLRKEAYAKEADPLFFKWQRGEATEKEWLDKIAEIKERYPKK